MLFHADCENIGPTIAVATAATSASPVSSCPDCETACQKPAAFVVKDPECPSISPSAVRPKSAANFATVRMFWIRVPALRPVALVAVSTRMTKRPTAWREVTEKRPIVTSLLELEIAGQKTPRNFPNATDTAAIVPDWTTRNIVHPKRKPKSGP